MIVLDANVLIAYLDHDDAHHAAALDIMEAGFLNGLATSVLTVAEALVHPTRAGRQDAAIASLRAIGVQIMSVDETTALALARLRADYRIRMPDAVALHTAVSTGSALATFDDSLIAAARRAGVAVAG